MTTPDGRLRSPVAEQRLPGHVNYFMGRDRGRWVVGVPTFARVVYREVWPGVDLAFHGGQGSLEYDLDLAPGADPARVALRFAGARAVRPDGRGGAVIELAGGTVRVRAPRAAQGARRVSSRLVVSGSTIRVALGAYDRARSLVVDPDLVYSTYLGWYFGASVAVDSGGDAYVTGRDSNCKYGQGDAFVTKLNPSGTAVVYSTFFYGNGGCASGNAIVADSAGDAFVTGEAGSNRFPTTPGAYQTTCASDLGLSGFVTELNPAGSGLVYSSLLCGGTGEGIALDSAGDAYVTGQAFGLFPTTPGAYQTSCGSGGGVSFVTKVNPTGSGLVYSTSLCGGRANAIAVDSSGDAYITGQVFGSFPTTRGAYQTTCGSGTESGFVTKLNPVGSGLVYSTLLCGGVANGIAVDSSGDAYVTGSTSSANFPTTPGAYQTSSGLGSAYAFVSKLNPAGSSLVYSTYLGSSWGGAQANAIAVDAPGDAYVTGHAGAAFPTTPGAYQTSYDGGWGDAFVTKLDPAGSSLLYSSYLSSATGLGIAIDSANDVFVTGQGWGSFPITPGAYQAGCGAGSLCATAAKLALGADVLWAPQVSPRTFALTGRRVNRRCVKVTRANRRHRRCTRPIKLRISYQLIAPAQITFTVTGRLLGRMSRGSCVPQTRKNRKHRSCTRPFDVAGTFTVVGGLGSNSFIVNGRIGGRNLAAGRYQLTGTPTVNGQAGTPQMVAFTIAS